jgi:hypothetical protein
MRHDPVTVTWFPDTVTEVMPTSLMCCPVPWSFTFMFPEAPSASLRMLRPKLATPFPPWPGTWPPPVTRVGSSGKVAQSSPEPPNSGVFGTRHANASWNCERGSPWSNSGSRAGLLARCVSWKNG